MFLIIALITSMCSFADPGGAGRHVDLRDQQALVELQRTNPVHYARILEIVAGLLAEPQRAEHGWLEASFDARDVDIEKLRYLASYPPKQLLRFTLDDTRYSMHLVRNDLDAKAIHAN